jgi:hypothetical protein
MIANVATRSGGQKQQNCGASDGKCGFSSGQGSRGGPPRNNGSGGHPGNPNNPYRDHCCDICEKLWHPALRCWKRLDKNFTGPEKMANTATTSYNLDPMWYADSATTDHNTGNLDKLIMTESYGVQDQVHTTNGEGMTIKHTSHSIVFTPSHHIVLKNVLHVPQAT